VDAGIDRTYVSRIERNLENPTVGVLDQLAGALGCQVIDFLDAARASRSPVSPLPSGRRKR
jgi:transcriptional regulator with XRE-family HTH domain